MVLSFIRFIAVAGAIISIALILFFLGKAFMYEFKLLTASASGKKRTIRITKIVRRKNVFGKIVADYEGVRIDDETNTVYGYASEAECESIGLGKDIEIEGYVVEDKFLAIEPIKMLRAECLKHALYTLAAVVLTFYVFTTTIVFS